MRIVTLILMSFLFACSGGQGTVNGELLSQHGEPALKLEAVPEPLQLLIFGGTSGIGLETARLALQRGHAVTSIARRPERMPIEHANLKNLKGDITKIESYQNLIEGKHAIISTIGLGPGRKPVTVYSKGMRSVLEGMRTKGVKRVLTVTGIGAGDSKGHGGFFYDKVLNPLMLKEDYKDKTRQEELLKDSDVDWTIIRPGFLTDEASRQEYRVIQKMQGFRSGSIARADVAHFIISATEEASHVNKTVFLSN